MLKFLTTSVLLATSLFTFSYTSIAEAQDMRRDVLPSILLKNQSAVQKVLGKPDKKCEKTKIGTTCFYENGRFEITYINGVVDWIKWYKPEGVSFFPGVMRFLGLKCPVTHQDLIYNQIDKMIIWPEGSCLGYKRISISPDTPEWPGIGQDIPVAVIEINARTEDTSKIVDLGIMGADGIIRKE